MSQIAENWLSDIIEATVSWLCVVRQRTTCAMFSTPCGQRSSEQDSDLSGKFPLTAIPMV